MNAPVRMPSTRACSSRVEDANQAAPASSGTKYCIVLDAPASSGFTWARTGVLALEVEVATGG
jgi:hypothetical protein